MDSQEGAQKRGVRGEGPAHSRARPRPPPPQLAFCITMVPPRNQEADTGRVFIR